MSRLILTIDQTPCRASYGLLGPDALRRDLAATHRGVAREATDNYVARGNRLATIAAGNGIADLAAELYLSEPTPEVIVVPVERPVFGLTEATGIDVVI